MGQMSPCEPALIGEQDSVSIADLLTLMFDNGPALGLSLGSVPPFVPLFPPVACLSPTAAGESGEVTRLAFV